MNIVDMRLRPPSKSWVTKPQYKATSPDTPVTPPRMGFPRPRSAEERSMGLLLQEMDQAGIKWGVAMGRQSVEPFGEIPNDELAEVIRQHPDRFVSFAGVDGSKSTDACLTEIRRCMKLPGFVGVSLEPPVSTTPMFSDDQRLYPIYELCQTMDIPISVSLSNWLCVYAGVPVEYSSPLTLYKVTRDFPKLDIVISHGAWPWVREVLGLAFTCPRIWLSPDLYMVGTNMPGGEDYIRAANLYLSDRTVFGTAYPTRPLVESVRAFGEWSFAPGVKEKILSKNALRLMRMKDGG
jgi:uncharacterized protein